MNKLLGALALYAFAFLPFLGIDLAMKCFVK